MTNTTLPNEVLKTDVLGRVKTPRARQEALLDEFERSGVSGKKFAALIGVNYQTFASWAQRRRRARGKYPLSAKPRSAPGALAGEQPMRLLEAVAEGGAPAALEGGPLCVALPGGAQMEVHDERQAVLAAELLRALVVRPC
jgi:hypothetical protein